MSDWWMQGKALCEAALTQELTTWLGKVYTGVYLFREGPTRSEFTWGNAEYLTENELGRLWQIRLFCQEYELFARRFGYEGDRPWQLRIAACEKHLADGQPLKPIDWGEQDETVLLLGEARGEEDLFDLKPNRYRRAELRYPGTWQAKQRCGLVAKRFELQPPEGGGIVCWRSLAALNGTGTAEP